MEQTYVFSFAADPFVEQARPATRRSAKAHVQRNGRDMLHLPGGL